MVTTWLLVGLRVSPLSCRQRGLALSKDVIPAEFTLRNSATFVENLNHETTYFPKVMHGQQYQKFNGVFLLWQFWILCFWDGFLREEFPSRLSLWVRYLVCSMRGVIPAKAILPSSCAECVIRKSIGV